MQLCVIGPHWRPLPCTCLDYRYCVGRMGRCLERWAGESLKTMLDPDCQLSPWTLPCFVVADSQRRPGAAHKGHASACAASDLRVGSFVWVQDGWRVGEVRLGTREMRKRAVLSCHCVSGRWKLLLLTWWVELWRFSLLPPSYALFLLGSFEVFWDCFSHSHNLYTSENGYNIFLSFWRYP